MEEQLTQTKRKAPKLVIVIILLILLFAGTAFGLYATGVIGSKDEGFQYATEGVVLTENDGGIYEEIEADAIALEFKNDAYSMDGQTFRCYIGNSPLNKYDMVLAIYADENLTDQIYLSGMVKPGNAFEEITLDRKLDPGDHRVYIAFTQMEDPKTYHAQTLYTMDFHVSPEA